MIEDIAKERTIKHNSISWRVSSDKTLWFRFDFEHLRTLRTKC